MKALVGKRAPNISLQDQTGNHFDFSSIKEDFVVIYFYPKDDTPGCTMEGQEFTKLLKKFAQVSTKVLGISGLDYKPKAKFCIKQKIGVVLLADEEFKIAKKYKSYGKKQFMGRSYMGILRNTFILNKSRKLVKIYESVKPEGHAAQVLEDIKGLTSGKLKTTTIAKKKTITKKS